MNRGMKWLLSVSALGCLIYVILLQIIAQRQIQVISMQKSVQSVMNKLQPVIRVGSATYPQNSQPILTMFTTFRNSTTKRYIYENTIRNWQLLSPDVIPILFTEVDPSDPMGIAHFAVQHGWHVFPASKTTPRAFPFWDTCIWRLRRNSTQRFIVTQMAISCLTGI